MDHEAGYPHQAAIDLHGSAAGAVSAVTRHGDTFVRFSPLIQRVRSSARQWSARPDRQRSAETLRRDRGLIAGPGAQMQRLCTFSPLPRRDAITRVGPQRAVRACRRGSPISIPKSVHPQRSANPSRASGSLPAIPTARQCRPRGQRCDARRRAQWSPRQPRAGCESD